jgi:DNA-binding beta-propeller fold protein YncE
MWWNAATVDRQTGTVFTLSRGHVDMLDGATGHLLRSLPTGPMPSAIAVDGRTGRAFVTTVDPLRYGLGRSLSASSDNGGILGAVRVWLARLPLPWLSPPSHNSTPRNGAVSVYTLAR